MRSHAIFFLICFLLSFASAHAERTVCVRVKETFAQVTPKPLKARDLAKERRLKLLKFTPLTWTGKKQGRFFEVQTREGATVWIRKSHVSFTESCVLVRVEKSRMMKGPGKKFEKDRLAQKGDSFLALGGEDGWTQVQDSNGNTAWINLDHIWRPSSKIRMSFSSEK
jgi:hypothetical protein